MKKNKKKQHLEEAHFPKQDYLFVLQLKDELLTSPFVFY